MKPTKNDFQARISDRSVRVRINPETYVKFDGTDHVVIQNAYSEAAVRIKYDIMLILYELVDWKVLQELLTPWPESDQAKILEYLEMFYKGQMLLVEGASEEAASEGERAEEPLNADTNAVTKVHINVENHHNMLRDYVRMAAYRRAIERAVKKDSVVLDLGSGTGVLSFFASQAGARQIFAIERQPHIVMLAKELAQRNGFTNVEFIEGVSNLLHESKIQPKADLLISEIIGDGILEENILEYTIDARDRFLKPTAELLPFRIDIYAFAYFSDIKSEKLLEVAEFKDLYGIDFSVLREVLSGKATLRRERYSNVLCKHLSEPTLVKTLDLRTLDTANFTQTFSLDVIEEAQMSGVCCYFKAWLDETTLLTNSPWAPATHWTNLMYTLPERQPVSAGEKVYFELIYDGALRLRPTEAPAEEPDDEEADS
jgi:SAM-dependent methyltransferase